jgi:hypothetical protein
MFLRGFQEVKVQIRLHQSCPEYPSFG